MEDKCDLKDASFLKWGMAEKVGCLLPAAVGNISDY